MDPLQNIINVSRNLYEKIKRNEKTFVGKIINIHDVANQTKCHIRTPPTTQNYIEEKSKEAEQNNIEIFVMNETCIQTLGINTSSFSFPVYTSSINPVLPKKRHIYYVITRNGIEHDDAFIICLANYFRLGGVPKSNVLIYTEDNYSIDKHGLLNIYERVLINQQKSHKDYDDFATFPKISITTLPLTEEEITQREVRKKRFSTGDTEPRTAFGESSVPKFIPINRTDEKKRKKVKEETKSEPKLEEGEINESNENTENYNDKKTSYNKRIKKYKEKYLKYRIKYEQLLKKTEKL